MPGQAVVQIIGTQVACKEGLKDTWREIAEWAAGQLKVRFGESVRLQYYDLFDPDCPLMPPHVQLPMILIDSQLLSSGEKISIPAIRKRLQELGIETIYQTSG
jgi:hypothetical protein